MAKTKYEQNVEPKLLQVEAWARNGLTDKQIAKNLGIAYSTFREYRDKHSAFSAVLKKGKEVIDIEVENALLKRALGYEYNETTAERDPNTGKMVVEKVVRKQIVPDTTAQIFWLKNRLPDKWRDRQSIDYREIDNVAEEITTLAKQLNDTE